MSNQVTYPRILKMNILEYAAIGNPFTAGIDSHNHHSILDLTLQQGMYTIFSFPVILI